MTDENPVKVLVRRYVVSRPDGSKVGSCETRVDALRLGMEAAMHDQMAMLPVFTATRDGIRFEAS